MLRGLNWDQTWENLSIVTKRLKGSTEKNVTKIQIIYAVIYSKNIVINVLFFAQVTYLLLSTQLQGAERIHNAVALIH